MSYQLAKTALNGSDRERLVCAFLHSQNKIIDFDAAAKDFGSATTNSFRVMYYDALKKLKIAVAKANGDEVPETPTKASSSSAGKKRKADAANDDGQIETRAKKGRASKKQLKKDKSGAGAGDEGSDTEIKVEGA